MIIYDIHLICNRIVWMINTIRFRITIIISLIVLFGGFLASLIGTYSVRETLKSQAFEKIRHDIQSAYALYQSEGEKIQSTIHLIAEGISFKYNEELLENRSLLERIRVRNNIDFLSIIDPDGYEVYSGKKISRRDLLSEREDGTSFTETLDLEELGILTGRDVSMYSIDTVETPYSYSEKRKRLEDVLTITSLSRFTIDGRVYILYGGIILNRNFAFVDRIREIIFSKEFYDGKPVGTVTLFSGPIRVATNVLLTRDRRAIGTVIQDVVGRAVLDNNQSFIGRAFVVNSWYLGAYHPIPTRDNSKAIIYVGLSESIYKSLESNLIIKFLIIAVISFVLIVIFSFFLISRIIYPIQRLSILSEQISRGDFSQRAETGRNDELGRLATTFNQMIESILTSRRMLEDYNINLQNRVKERTDELMKIKEQMIQSEKLASIGRLSAGVAHEINNPLGAILSYAHLIKEELDDKCDTKKIEEFAGQIISETNRTKNIIKSLLEFSRQHRSEYDWVDINQIVDDAINLIQIQKKADDVRIVKEFGTDIPIVKIDAERIKEAIINIIINAMDAMNDRGVITIKTSVDHKKKIFSISIGDTGGGIPEEILGHIFEPFFTTKPVGKGTGLGLSVTYGIVKQHNGDIVVNTKIGEGTTFTIVLPLHP